MSLGHQSPDFEDHNSQGKIHTENADLISLLTENSSDTLVSKSRGPQSLKSGRNSSVNPPLDLNNNSKTELSQRDYPSAGDTADTRNTHTVDSRNTNTVDSRTSNTVESRNNNSRTDRYPSPGETGDPRTTDSRAQTGRESFPQPKPSALLPSARGSSAAVFTDPERWSSSSVTAVANPDILRASGIEPAQPNQHFPRYVSLKSKSLTTPQSSAVEEEEEEEEEETPRNSPARSETNSPEKENLVPPEAASRRKSPTLISADSLEFTDRDFDKFLPSEKTEDKDQTPFRTPSIVIQEDTFLGKRVEGEEEPSVDQNLLQAPTSKVGHQLKSHNPLTPEGYERDSLSGSENFEEKTPRINESSASQRSRVFMLRNENSMSGNRKVYVESPTFTKDEEDEYRFVSSRIDDYNDMNDTYRQLDENTLEEKPKKKSSGKRVRYQDTDRFEDKNQVDLEEDARLAQRSVPGNDVTTKSALKNPSRQEYTQSPSRALTIPDGPLDPKEAEELERETVYQDYLKQKIDENKRQIETEDIPRLPLSPETSRDFAQDSLDLGGAEYGLGRGSRARDSLELYQGVSERSGPSRYGEMENTKWNNPPQPFSGAVPRQPPSEDAGGQFQRQNAMDGYNSEPDFMYQQRRDELGYPDPPSDSTFRQVPQGFQQPQGNQNPQGYQNQQPNYQNPQQSYQTQPEYYQPPNPPQSGYYDTHQGQPQRNPHISSFLPEDRGINQSYDSEASYRPTYNEYYQGNQNGGYGYENGVQDRGSYNRLDVAGSFPNSDGQVDRYVNEDLDSGMEITSPRRPRYNYISNNKIDYGRQPPRSYKQIKDIKNEEKARAESLFVKPKLKPKENPKGHSSARTVNSLDEANNFQPGLLKQKPASAEDLWAQRAANLQQRSAGKNGKKKKPGSKLVKYPSENGLSVAQRAPVIARPAFNPAAVVPAVGSPVNSYGSAPNSLTSSPTRRPLELKPISQEVVTSDGQRISVDVNLKLMNPFEVDGHPPAPSQGYIQDVTDPVPIGHQYPVQDYRNPQEYADPYQQNYLGHQAYGGAHQGSGVPHSGYIAQQDYGTQPQYGSQPPYGSQPQYGSQQQAYPQDVRERLSSNAYPKIPPIPSSSDSKHSDQSELEDGYVAQFRKQREKRDAEDRPWYKVYGINDYRKMQKEVRLGALGPDLDNDIHKERSEKMQRQMQYARMVMEKNKQAPQKKPPSYPKPKEQDDIMNKRKVAIEYAKTVPKPAVQPVANPYNSYEVATQIAGVNPSPKQGQKQRYKQPVVDVIDLDKLQQRHERDKQNVAKIRENMDGAVAQNA